MSRKTKYFLPILIFSYLSVSIIHRFDLYFVWIFGWPLVYTASAVYFNVLHSYFIGCFAWSIIAYYLGTINIKRYRKGVKSIILFYPFWLGVSIFLSSTGLSSYSNAWIVIHVLLRFWVGIGLFIATIMVVNFLASRIYKPIIKNRLYRAPMELDKIPSEPKSYWIRFVNLSEKYQLKLFIFIILVMGIFFIASSIIGSEGITYLSSIFLFFTLIIINTLYDINYLFSKREDSIGHIKIRKSWPPSNEFDNLLNKFRELIDEGNDSYSKESYEAAIQNWSKAVEIYLRLSNFVIQQKMLEVNLNTLKENLNDAYNGAVIVHLKNAQEAYKNFELETARKEWKSAIKDLYSILRLRKFGKSNITRKEIISKIKDISPNLKRLEIEVIIAKADEDLKSAHVLQDKELAKTINLTDNIIQIYSNAKKKAQN
ncbi:MAG: hypothetical protein ACFFA4_00935, partial [Promethearchaeota archaeon]